MSKKTQQKDYLSNLKGKVVAFKQQDAVRVLTVDTDLVYPDPDQPRKNFDEEKIARLGDTMAADGQLQAVKVHPADSDGRYKIKHGERRWRAAVAKGIKIDIIIDNGPKDEARDRRIQLIENIQREDLLPLENAMAVNGLRDAFGLSPKEISEALGYSQTWVSTHLALNPKNLPECVKEIADARITLDYETLNTLRKLSEINPELCEQICSASIENGISRKDAIYALQNAKKIESDVKAEQNKPEKMKIDNRESAAESEHKKELKEAGLNEPGLPHDNAEMSQDDITATEVPENDQTVAESIDEENTTGTSNKNNNPLAAGWTKREAQYASIIVNVATEKEVIKGKLILDRLDTDPQYMWVGVMKLKSDKMEYKRIHVSEIEIAEVIN